LKSFLIITSTVDLFIKDSFKGNIFKNYVFDSINFTLLTYLYNKHKINQI